MFLSQDELKIALLSTNLFLDNQYLNSYCELVMLNINNQFQKFVTQKHHIIPRSAYTILKLDVDNSKNNLVVLKYQDHILCHYYLSLCSIGQFRQKCIHSFLYLINLIDKRVDSYIVQDMNLDKLPYYQELYEEDQKLQSLANKGGKWMNNGSVQQYVVPKQIEEFKLKGYVIGKLPYTDEQRQACSVRNSKLMKNYYSTHTISEETRKKRSSSLKGKKRTEEQRKRISDSKKGSIPWNKDKKGTQGANKASFCTGHVPWNKGKHFSEESKEKMRQSALNRKDIKGRIWVNNGQKRKLITPDLLQEYIAKGYQKGFKILNEKE